MKIKILSLALFLLHFIITKSQDDEIINQDEQFMSDEEFIEIMNSQERVIAGSNVHLKMHSLAQRAMGITSMINNKYNSPKELRKRMSLLMRKELDEGFGLFPPFTTDCGINIHLEKNVFINSGCRFQDQGGIYIGENSLIGHDVILATLNHNIDPYNRADLYPKPIHIGKRVWIGSRSIVLPGITIGDNSIVGAGSVVTKDIPPNTIYAGNPAKFIKNIDIKN